MCGIVGIIQPENKGPVDPGILQAMNTALRHRGPDDEGYWIKGPAGLGMRRLSIIDLEGGRQPIANEAEDVWAVFNGEIYNFRELRSELVQKGHRFRTRADTEVIVHLYEEEGEAFVERLRGMFAIAVWDERARKLLLYRDRIGIKPLHYWFQAGLFLFASEIKAILEHPAADREISLPALSDYLSFLYIPAPRTIYRDIQKLEPGHFLRLQNGRLEIRPYWEFSYGGSESVSEKVWAERLRAALEESVRMHLVSDVPVGAFLSGGLDSSTVTALMSRSSAEPVKTYSIGFTDERFNELPYAREIASRFKTSHHEQIVRADAFDLLPKIAAGFDEPFADSSAIPTYLVSEFARREVKVVLSGDGGDELFGGYLWTQKEIWLERYRCLPAALRRAVERLVLEKGYHPLRERGLGGLIRRFIYDAGRAPCESFARRAMNFQPWMKEKLLQPWVLEALKEDKGSDRMRALFDGAPAREILDKLLYLDSKIYLPDDLLTKVDRMSMMHSLEVRVPLLDHKVAELAGKIPFPMKMRGGVTKVILKRAVKGILPAKILRQRKQGFSVPLGRWFQGELYGFAKELLLSPEGAIRRFFCPEYVAWLLEEHRAGRQHFGPQLYALVVFELWSRSQARTKKEPLTRISIP